MKFLTDFIPLLLFFGTYKLYGIYAATLVAIIATAGMILFQWITHRRIDAMQWVLLALVCTLGSATLLFQDDSFIKWKPSIVYWLLAAGLWTSQLVNKPLLQKLLGANLSLPMAVWRRLNTLWALFFTGMGFLNAWVAFNFDTNTWVNFKLFGVLGLTLLFVLGQAWFLSRHIEET